MDNPKILAITEFYPTQDRSHRGSFIHRRIKQLIELGCDVQVFCPTSITLGTYLRSLKDVVRFYKTTKISTYTWDRVTVHDTRYHGLLPSRMYSRRTANLAYKAIKAELLNLQHRYEFNAFQLIHGGPLCLAAGRIAKELRIPCILDVGTSDIGTYYQKPNNPRYKVQKEIMLACDLVVCVSDRINQIVTLMTNGRVKTVTHYAGVDTKVYRRDLKLRETYRDKIGYSESDIVLVFVGYLMERKGIYELIEVFTHLSKKIDNLHLLLVGELVERRKVMWAIRTNGVESRILLTGAVPPNDVIGYLNAGDVFVFPSHNEGLPNAVVEACACGLPVVASNVDGIPEIIEDEVSGLLIKPKDKTDLYKKILWLLASPEEALVFGKKARERIVRKFNYNKNGHLIVRRVESIIGVCRSVEEGNE